MAPVAQVPFVISFTPSYDEQDWLGEEWVDHERDVGAKTAIKTGASGP